MKQFEILVVNTVHVVMDETLQMNLHKMCPFFLGANTPTLSKTSLISDKTFSEPLKNGDLLNKKYVKDFLKLTARSVHPWKFVDQFYGKFPVFKPQLNAYSTKSLYSLLLWQWLSETL